MSSVTVISAFFRLVLGYVREWKDEPLSVVGVFPHARNGDVGCQPSQRYLNNEPSAVPGRFEALCNLYATQILPAVCGKSKFDTFWDNAFRHPSSNSCRSDILVALYRVYLHRGKVTVAPSAYLVGYVLTEISLP